MFYSSSKFSLIHKINHCINFWVLKDGRHKFQKRNLHYRAHIKVGFAFGSRQTHCSVVLARRHGAILQVQETTVRPQQRILNGKRETEGKYENRETAMITNKRCWSKQPANAWRQCSSRCCILSLEMPRATDVLDRLREISPPMQWLSEARRPETEADHSSPTIDEV